MNNPNNTVQTICFLLAIAVLADKRQRDQELVEFVHAVTKINQHLRPDIIMPRQSILDWYETEKPNIIERLASENAQEWKASLLDDITDDELRNMVLASLYSISVSDYELHDEECKFLKLASQNWGIEIPQSEMLEHMTA